MNPKVESASDSAHLSGNGYGQRGEALRPLAAHPDSVAADAITPGLDRILVVRLGSMGDIIHSLPAVSTLRAAFPDARIDWVIEERWSELLCSRPELRAGSRRPEKPLIDSVHVVNTRAWRMSLLSERTRSTITSVVRALRQPHYHAAIDLQSAVKSALVARASGAPLRFGFVRPIERPAGLFYNRRVQAAGRHMVDQNISLAMGAIEALGGAQCMQPVYDFPFPHDAQQDEWVTRELARRSIGQFVLLNPGAGWGAKCWPPERYAQVAQDLALNGLSSIVNYGPGEEALARRVVEMGGSSAHGISCSIGQLIALARRARLCIGGDTGPTHLAAALRVPVVGIYGPTDPARNGPFGAPMEVLRSVESVTSHSRRGEPEAGLLSMTVAEATSAARRLLQRTAHEERV
jgi:heptosyltransferase I